MKAQTLLILEELLVKDDNDALVLSTYLKEAYDYAEKFFKKLGEKNKMQVF